MSTVLLRIKTYENVFIYVKCIEIPKFIADKKTVKTLKIKMNNVSTGLFSRDMLRENTNTVNTIKCLKKSRISLVSCSRHLLTELKQFKKKNNPAASIKVYGLIKDFQPLRKYLTYEI